MQNEPVPSFLRPPPERGVPLGWWLAGLLVLGVLALQLLRLGLWAPAPGEAPAAASTSAVPQAARPMPERAAIANRPARPMPTPAQRGETVVTRCVTGGRTTFTDGDCAPGAQATELRVQRDLNLADGAAHLPRARPQPRAAIQAAGTGGGSPSVVAADRRAECAALARQIERWDAMARQPQSAQTQDWINARRQQARSRQFQLRC